MKCDHRLFCNRAKQGRHCVAVGAATSLAVVVKLLGLAPGSSWPFGEEGTSRWTLSPSLPLCFSQVSKINLLKNVYNPMYFSLALVFFYYFNFTFILEGEEQRSFIIYWPIPPIPKTARISSTQSQELHLGLHVNARDPELALEPSSAASRVCIWKERDQRPVTWNQVLS